ncbi:hypothetical protein KIAC18_002118 [Sporomusa sphaeroides]|uniref:hypothetical protein n=1 Tax=Sporomusa sphaeroides TaxID=47679 RepID=UPI003DA1551F
MNEIKIMDVSLRDGGYLNNWQFCKEQVKRVCSILDDIKIDYIEVGYLSDELCLGMDNKIALELLAEIKKNICHSQLVLMVNPKNKTVRNKVFDFSDYISYIRIPCDFTNLKNALILAESIKKTNIKVSLNLISITQYNYDELLDFIASISNSNLIDMIYVADSRGSLRPREVLEIIRTIKLYFHKKIGFHAHNNLGLAFANTLMSIKAGCELVDGSMNGVGLGGGNTHTELLLRYVKGMDTGCSRVEASTREFVQLLNLVKPEGLERQLYRLSAAKNLEQEWVPPLMEKYRNDSLAVIERISRKSYKNCEDIHEILLNTRREVHA